MNENENKPLNISRFQCFDVNKAHSIEKKYEMSQNFQQTLAILLEKMDTKVKQDIQKL